MLYPQTNRCRTVLDLCGFWQVKVDADDRGLEKGWACGFAPDATVGVPGSWNEQLAELGMMNYVGTTWYQTKFHVPNSFLNNRIHLRFGSADSDGRVWLNGKIAGAHSGGFLPFETDVTDLVNSETSNLLVVRVNNALTHDTIPQGCSEEDYKACPKSQAPTFPPSIFDFFNYGGLNRPVKIVALPRAHLSSVKIDTSLDGANGILKFSARFSGAAEGQLVVTLLDGEDKLDAFSVVVDGSPVSGEFVVKNCRFWSIEAPHLYQLHFQLTQNQTLVDEYRLDAGVREIKVDGFGLRLNGKPVFLRGFCKHEDFDVIGKGLSYPLVAKDFQMMKWLGANSFRTSHYPYAEEVMQMADRLGFLVIDEVPAVSLNLRFATPATLSNHKKALTELVARDYNHPSVICWSVANEPGIWGEEEAMSEKAEAYWKSVFGHVRQLDATRPVTLPSCIQAGHDTPAFRLCDIISVNRYWGWYDYPGDVERAGQLLKEELETLHRKYGKPIMVSEFGADAIEGAHASFPQLFTEEYQSALIRKYFDIIESLPFMVGEHIWNFADFRTAQSHGRVILNRKGVLNRQRVPKASAFMIRNRWLGLNE